MTFRTIAKRLLVYGGITMALSGPVIYDIGYEKGKEESSIVHTYKSKAKGLAEKGAELKDKAYKTIDELFK